MNSDTQDSFPRAKDIALTGYSSTPSDRQCADGDLSCSYNMINEEGAMSPIMNPPQVLGNILQNVKRAFIHTVEGGRKKNLVVVHTIANTWMVKFYVGIQDYLEGKATGTDISAKLSSLIVDVHGDVSIAAVGNTLVLSSHQEKRYVLWKVGEGDDGGYVDLGGDIPAPSLTLKLYTSRYGEEWYYSRPEKTEDREVEVQCRVNPNQEPWTKEENQMIVHNAIMAMCNKFIAECHQKGRFMFPFLVRYAWRLFDGTLTKHSAPILMMPSTRVAPIVDVTMDVSGLARCTPMAMTSNLHYRVEDPSLNDVQKWKDIITALEIFVSPPLYSYRQDINSYSDEDFRTYSFVQGSNPDSFGVGLAPDTNQAWYYGNFIGIGSGKGFFVPQYRSVKDMRQQIEECSTFHHLYTIDLNDPAYFPGGRILTRDEVGDLTNLVSREAMTDDYDSRDCVKGQKAFAYNNRISLANIRKTLYGGGLVRDVSTPLADVANEYVYQVYFFIKTSSGVSVVTSGTESGISAMVPYLYYPNMGCYKAVIKRTKNGSSQYMEVQMKPHKFLNGSVWVADPDTLMPSVERSPRLGGFVPDWFTPSGGNYTGLVPSNDEVLLPNKIYTSEVDNPFVTMVTNIATVGQGEIMGVSTAAKALSQGQFGQFPLYAFSTDGVWALSVSSTGGFSSVQPITQDVCTNPESITQLDSSVVFSTQRGLMQISGSSAECITDRISAIDPFNLADLPGMTQLHTMMGHNESDGRLPTHPFKLYLQGAVVLYDYVHQRLYLGNPFYKYTYVYSLKSSQWGWYGGSLAMTLNSYPHALAFTNKDNTSSVYDFSKDGEMDDRLLQPGLIVTRPIKLDAADTLKTAVGVYLRGLFRPTNAAVVLWGSRDLQNWNLLGSSNRYYLEGVHGDGYKYFRVGVKSSLKRGDRITGLTFAFITRMTNRIR